MIEDRVNYQPVDEVVIPRNSPINSARRSRRFISSSPNRSSAANAALWMFTAQKVSINPSITRK